MTKMHTQIQPSAGIVKLKATTIPAMNGSNSLKNGV